MFDQDTYLPYILQVMPQVFSNNVSPQLSKTSRSWCIYHILSNVIKYVCKLTCVQDNSNLSNAAYRSRYIYQRLPTAIAIHKVCLYKRNTVGSQVGIMNDCYTDYHMHPYAITTSSTLAMMVKKHQRSHKWFASLLTLPQADETLRLTWPRCRHRNRRRHLLRWCHLSVCLLRLVAGAPWLQSYSWLKKSSQDLGIVGKTWSPNGIMSHINIHSYRTSMVERGGHTQPRFLAVGVARKLAIWQRLPILAMEKRVFRSFRSMSHTGRCEEDDVLG